MVHFRCFPVFSPYFSQHFSLGNSPQAGIFRIPENLRLSLWSAPGSSPSALWRGPRRDRTPQALLRCVSEHLVTRLLYIECTTVHNIWYILIHDNTILMYAVDIRGCSCLIHLDTTFFAAQSGWSCQEKTCLFSSSYTTFRNQGWLAYLPHISSKPLSTPGKPW